MSIGSDPRPGSDIAGYRLEGLLGRGGMGAVYLAEDLRLGRKVALKLLVPELAEDERFRDRFLRESQISASLDHPHIVPIYAAGEAEGQLYLAMRYVEGYDLRQLLATEGRLEPRRALALLEQVADALDAAHEKSLIHRDVKPGNVLIAERSGRQHCYLADFGLTKQTSSISGLTGTGELVGTVNYVSPEQIRGEAVDGRADVYALGCMLYECLTGEPPFARESEVATLWAHVNEQPAPVAAARPELGRDIDQVLARALAKAPGDRYASCHELAGSARAALGVSDASAPAPPLPRRARRLGLPRGRVGGLLAAGMAALLAAAVALVLLVRGPEEFSGIGPTSVGVIDPATNELVAEIPLGAKLPLIDAGEGSIWVVDRQGWTLTRIDPKTRKIVPPTLGLPAAGAPNGLAVGEGSLWIAQHQITRVAENRHTGRVVVLQTGAPPDLDFRNEIVLEEIEGTSPPQRETVLLALGDGAVFALELGRGEVTRIDPKTGATVELAEDVNANSIAASEGAVWLGGKLGVTKLDSETGAELATASLANVAEAELTSIAVGADAVWFAASSQPRLMRIHLAGSVLDSFAVGRGPSAIVVGDDGAVWVANSRDGTVSRLDPQSEAVETINLGQPVGGIVAAYDGVWTSPLDQSQWGR